jgi:23S rRNA (cytidine1920-2'-O)/16S rRNA (cytidine1409-2'-O)-methyltransferase
MRLDVALVARGLTQSRTQAASAVLAGEVFVDGVRAGTPAQRIAPDAAVEVRPRRPRYVSRGGEKLEHALGVFGVAVNDLRTLDAGASTGGFTDCLLQRGAHVVYAVDVGTGQLHWRLRQDPRVVSLERTDIRRVRPEELGGPVDLATVDVAFISLAHVLPRVAALVRPGGVVLALVKPQFEAGPKRAPRGVVRDAAVHREVLRRVLDQAAAAGLPPVGAVASPIAGADGNLEFFICLRRGSSETAAIDVDAVVAQAHATVPRAGLGRTRGPEAAAR